MSLTGAVILVRQASAGGLLSIRSGRLRAPVWTPALDDEQASRLMPSSLPEIVRSRNGSATSTATARPGQGASRPAFRATQERRCPATRVAGAAKRRPARRAARRPCGSVMPPSQGAAPPSVGPEPPAVLSPGESDVILAHVPCHGPPCDLGVAPRMTGSTPPARSERNDWAGWPRSTEGNLRDLA